MDGSNPHIGHNNPPDPIDESIAPYAGAIAETENWLDGTTVETEAQMQAVDLIIKDVRKAKTTVNEARLDATAPLRKAVDDENKRWKPTQDDLERRLNGLVSFVDAFKRKLADEKEAAKRAAYAEARRKEDEARAAAAKADATDYGAQVKADRLAQEAQDAKKAAAAANKDTVKGLRKVTRHEITDIRGLVNWIAANDKAAMADFATEYARKHHKTKTMSGVNVWDEKESY